MVKSKPDNKLNWGQNRLGSIGSPVSWLRVVLGRVSASFGNFLASHLCCVRPIYQIPNLIEKNGAEA